MCEEMETMCKQRRLSRIEYWLGQYNDYILARGVMPPAYIRQGLDDAVDTFNMIYVENEVDIEVRHPAFSK